MPPYSLTLETSATPAAASNRRKTNPLSRDCRARAAATSTVLLAEDNRYGRQLLEQLLVTAGLASVRCAPTNNAAIDYLAGRGEFADRDAHPFPSVVLLDLAMGGGHGLDVLAWMAGQPTLPACAVYVLTETREPELRRQAYRYGVAGYLQKPLSLAQIVWIVEDRLALAG